MATIFSFHPRAPAPSPSPSPSPSSSPTSKPSIGCFSTFNFNSYSTSIITQINHHLTTILHPMHNNLDPQSLHSSMQNSVLNLNSNNDHHFLPILTIASCELVGGDRNSIIPTACAIEIAHAASLLHEKQLYCSTSSKHDQGLAVLTGDSLFFRSFECVVRFTPLELVQDFIVQQVILEISKGFGSTGVAGGKSMKAFLSCEEDMVSVLKREFGAMTECSAACGGLIGGAGEAVMQSLRKYGMALGVWKQVMNEILGFDEGKSELRLVKVVGMERAMEMEEEFKKEAMRELEKLEEKYGESVLPLHSMLEIPCMKD